MVRKIKIYSGSIIDMIGYPGLTIEESEEERAYRLERQKDPESILVGKDNVTKISMSDDWR